MIQDRADFSRLRVVDGMRGWGAVVVFIHHLVLLFLAKANPIYVKDPIGLSYFLMDGHLAVFIFFVLSGIALSYAFFERQEFRLLTHGALRRYFRLTIPVFVISMIVFFMMKAGFMINVEAAKVGKAEGWLDVFYKFKPTWDHLFQFSFSDVYFKYDRPTSFNSPLWTMQYELTGSFLVFGLAGLTYYLKRPIISLILFSSVVFVVSPLLTAFPLGVAIGLMEQSEKWKALARKGWMQSIFILAILFVIAFSIATMNPNGLLGKAISGLTGVETIRLWHGDKYLAPYAAVFVLACLNIGWIRSFFENGVSKFFGKYSFSLYLVHMPVICSVSSFTFLALAGKFGLAMAANITLLVTVPLVFILMIIFEPVDRFAVNFSRKFADWVMTSHNAKSASFKTRLKIFQD